MVKKYEGIFIFDAMVKDEAMDAQIDRARSEISRLDGEVIEIETLGKRTFARPQRKRDHGIFVRVVFKMDADNIVALNARYRLMDTIFRVQILSIDDRKQQKLVDQAERLAASSAMMAKDDDGDDI